MLQERTKSNDKSITLQENNFIKCFLSQREDSSKK